MIVATTMVHDMNTHSTTINVVIVIVVAFHNALSTLHKSQGLTKPICDGNWTILFLALHIAHPDKRLTWFEQT